LSESHLRRIESLQIDGRMRYMRIDR
jgi:hypothetical protein